MYSSYDRSPAWYRDAKWLSGVLLVVMLALATLFFSLASLTREAPAVELLKSVLQLTLLPQGGALEPQMVTLQGGFDYQVGAPLVLLPGVASVVVDATELDDFTVADARGRIAGVLADTVIAQGRAGVLTQVTDSTLRTQLDRALSNTLLLATEALLSSSMMPSGLADGSRLANWQLQAQQNPGQEVQPIVGVFVRFPPAQLQPLSAQQIGERVVRALAEVTLAEGLGAAQQLVTNANLQERLTTTVNQGVRAQLHTFIDTLLTDREEELASRLEQARDLSARQQEAAVAQAQFQQLAGQDVSGLAPEEANQVVLENLATVAYVSGADEVVTLMSDAGQQTRLSAARPAVAAFTAESHRRFVRLSWIFGVLSALLLAALLVFSRGLNRILNAGVAITLSALGGAWGLWTLYQRAPNAAGAPAGLQSEGAFGQLVGLFEYLLANLPESALWLLTRNYLIVLTAGVGLMAFYLLMQLWRLFRPRRRAF
jgi:hypothetical protein